MNCAFRFLRTKELLGTSALSLLVLFSPVLSHAQITPAGDSYINTADATVNYVLGTMLGYFVAVELVFTILVACACATVMALIGIYISNQRAKSEARRTTEQRRSALDLDQTVITRMIIATRGQIVGSSTNCQSDSGHAFLWENGGPMIDLNTFVPPGSDLTLTQGAYINDHGEILVSGTLPNGDSRTVLLIPCGEGEIGCTDAATVPVRRGVVDEPSKKILPAVP